MPGTILGVGDKIFFKRYSYYSQKALNVFYWITHTGILLIVILYDMSHNRDLYKISSG